MIPEKKFDCPLCGKKNAITQSAQQQETVSGADQGGKGTKRILGNYTMHWTGGKYDYSHAKACKKLRGVAKPKDLLAHYLGTSVVTYSDLASYEDYVRLLKGIGVHIRTTNKNAKTILGKRWHVHMTLVHKGKRIPNFPDAVALKPEDAFSVLRHRLLCGEIIIVGNKKFHAVSKDGTKAPQLLEIS